MVNPKHLIFPSRNVTEYISVIRKSERVLTSPSWYRFKSTFASDEVAASRPGRGGGRSGGCVETCVMAAHPAEAAVTAAAAAAVVAANEPPPGAEGVVAAAGPIAAALATLAAVWDDGTVVEVSLRRLATGAAVLALVLAIVAAVRRVRRRTPVDQRAAFFALFEARIRNEFPAQPAESLATLLTGVYSVMRPSPERPCVLLFLASPGAAGVALRLARATAASVQAALRGCAGGGDRLEVLGTRHAAFEDYWRFYEALSGALAEHGVAIVRDVHALHPQVATALAQLTDDTFAPYTQAVLLLLADLSERFSSVELSRCEAVTLAERFLSECWQMSLDTDVLPELLSRLTGRAVLVSPEPG